MKSRRIVNWVLPFFSTEHTAQDYVFLLLFEERQGATGFITTATAALSNT